MSSLQETRARLISHFTGGSAKQGLRWEELWANADFLPWDRHAVNPALIDILADRQDLIGGPTVQTSDGRSRRRRALVPGCGRGYDVLLFASFGYDTVGLEVSASAVEACWEERDRNESQYPMQDASVGRGQIDFMQGDFFEDDWTQGLLDGQVDLIYDYTFLSALPPSLRPSWALKMSKTLSTEGRLICVEFPSTKDPKLNGPPWALPPTVYLAHLSRPGEEVQYDRDSGHVDESELSHSNNSALRRIAHWQPSRTHEIGKGTDWVSVWTH